MPENEYLGWDVNPDGLPLVHPVAACDIGAAPGFVVVRFELAMPDDGPPIATQLKFSARDAVALANSLQRTATLALTPTLSKSIQ